MSVPKELLYTQEHEWVSMEDSIATIGITDFAQSSLGDITFVQLPKEGETLNKDDTFGVVESVKAVSDLFAPVSGRVIEVNDPLAQAPELLNDDPYNEGWLIKLETKDVEAELGELMSPKEYEQYVEDKGN
jgi:glycine cleavage system H protein